MGKSAFVLGGSGVVGSHLAQSLSCSGWEVTIASRGKTEVPPEIRHLPQMVVDRRTPGALQHAVGRGVDVLIDVIPYEVGDAEQAVALKDGVGSVIAISTASVYADRKGRTLDESKSRETFPRVPVPIPEDQSRVALERDTYSAKKAAMEDVLLGQNDLPATVIRPCAIYGPGAKHCREWFFVKRILDQRRQVLLAYEGESVFHTTAADNLAELVRLAAERPGTRVLNCGDPDPPNVRGVVSSIAGALGYEWEEVLVPPHLSDEPFLANPWAVPAPWVLDMRKAREDLGYAPVTTYAEAVADAVEWIIQTVSNRGSRAFSNAIPYLPRAFDYEAEDAFMRDRD